MRTLLAMAMLIGAGSAQAAPAFLSCTGTAATRIHDQLQPEGKDSYSITLDLATNKLTLNDEQLPIVDVGDNTITASFTPPGGRWVLVDLNRVTGKVDISMIQPLRGDPNAIVTTFGGICRPAQKLF